MDKSSLKMLQSLPLDVKVQKTKNRIIEWVEYYGIDKVYSSFSGGVGSTVLYFILQEIAHEQGWDRDGVAIPCLFANSRNEMPDVVKHVFSLKAQHNSKYKKIMGDMAYNCVQNYTDCIVIRKPKMFFREVIEKYGYLVLSKKTSRCIYDIRKLKIKNDGKSNERIASLLNPRNRFSVPKRWQFLIDTDIKISHKCCGELKHRVFDAYERETGRIYPITGEQASESYLRETTYLKYGCNGFDRRRPRSMPLGFWTATDLLNYLLIRTLPYPKCYGQIISKDGQYTTTGEKRTGCRCCLANISCSNKNEENRFQRMEHQDPVFYKLMFTPFEDGGLGAGLVLDIMNIPYHAKEILDMEEFIELFNF
jgi:3'-phosphoadenosine 5'-phosphosulfate sulfotransferase (PAPS reductase)/FAD synthetase